MTTKLAYAVPLQREKSLTVPSAAARTPGAASSAQPWHVSPSVDMLAYHFSWLLVLVPMLLLGKDRFSDYLWVYALVLGVNFAHRHYGLPYAYLDRDVFTTHRGKLLVMPALCLCALALTPALASGRLGGVAGQRVLGALVFFSLLWNFWHVYMQKYGLLRVYMAKAQIPAERKTPGWADRFMVLCWFPLYFCYLGPTQKDLILTHGSRVAAYTKPIIEVMETERGWLLVPSTLVVVAAFGIWAYFDFRAHRFRNGARLSAALGLGLLSSSLLWLDPIKVYLAFGFSHAIEYMVFVWAYQRKRYSGTPVSQPSPMAALVRHPGWYYGLFTVSLCAIAITKALWGRAFLQGIPAVIVLGLSGANWFHYYAVFESLVHFHMDGYLWKMRRPEVRASL